MEGRQNLTEWEGICKNLTEWEGISITQCAKYKYTHRPRRGGGGSRYMRQKFGCRGAISTKNMYSKRGKSGELDQGVQLIARLKGSVMNAPAKREYCGRGQNLLGGARRMEEGMW